MINKKNILIALFTGVSAVSCGALIGEVREKDGKDYIVPYSREGRGNLRVDEKGVQYREKFLNDRDNSNEIIVYSDLDDAPARHCLGKDGHPILRENQITKEMERICRLDTPGSRVEGSKIEVDEIQYYIANTENKYVFEKTYEEKSKSEEKRVYSNDEYTKYAKFTRPDKEKEIRDRYLEPKGEVQAKLRALYKEKLFEQYGINE